MVLRWSVGGCLVGFLCVFAALIWWMFWCFEMFWGAFGGVFFGFDVAVFGGVSAICGGFFVVYFVFSRWFSGVLKWFVMFCSVFFWFCFGGLWWGFGDLWWALGALQDFAGIFRTFPGLSGIFRNVRVFLSSVALWDFQDFLGSSWIFWDVYVGGIWVVLGVVWGSLIFSRGVWGILGF